MGTFGSTSFEDPPDRHDSPFFRATGAGPAGRFTDARPATDRSHGRELGGGFKLVAVPKAEPGVRIAVKVKPRASQSRLTQASGLDAEARLAAPPVDGAANEELLRLLSDALEIKRSALELVIGQSSKHKVVEVRGLSPEQVAERLSRAATRG